MKWKTSDTTPPKLGDTYRRDIFSLLPRDCSDGYTRWLERVTIAMKFVEQEISDGELMGIPTTHTIQCYVEISAHPLAGSLDHTIELARKRSRERFEKLQAERERIKP